MFSRLSSLIISRFHDLSFLLQIIFEGVAKDLGDPLRRYRGYIAIDNVARKPGSECKGHCTFEGGFCSWFNEEGDDFQWSLVSIKL